MQSNTSNIQNHIKYWDEWHAEWYRYAKANYKDTSKPLKDDTILTWGLLNEDGGTNESAKFEKAWKFFPEPYWGNPKSQNLQGVFINFNPGNGGHSQHINTAAEYLMNAKVTDQLPAFHCHEIWQYYLNGLTYYETIQALYKTSNYPTTNWMQSRRERFINKYLDQLSIPRAEGSEFVMFELCPWHTRIVTKGVRQYIKGHIKEIDGRILDFAFACSQSAHGFFQNIVLAHGLDAKSIAPIIGDTCLEKVERALPKIPSSKDEGKKEWIVDVYKSTKHKNCFLVNFKNSANNFPAITKELATFFEALRC